MAQVDKLQYGLVVLFALHYKSQVLLILPFYTSYINNGVYMPFSTPTKLDIDSVISVPITCQS